MDGRRHHKGVVVVYVFSIHGNVSVYTSIAHLLNVIKVMN